MTWNWLARASRALRIVQPGTRSSRRRRAGLRLESLETRLSLTSLPPVPAGPNLNIIVLRTPESRVVPHDDSVRFENRAVPDLAEKAYAQVVAPSYSRQNTGFVPFDTSGSMTHERQPITPTYGERLYPVGAGSSAILNPDQVGEFAVTPEIQGGHIGTNIVGNHTDTAVGGQHGKPMD